MRILHITAGTGKGYCGTCIRDQNLNIALRKRGVDVTVMPLYLPLVTETELDGQTPIFLGGINLYLQNRFSFFRSSPAWFDRWLNHPSLLRFVARFTHMTKTQELGELTLACLSGREGRLNKAFEQINSWIRSQKPFDLFVISNALLSGIAPALKRDFDVPILCVLQGEDSFIDSLDEHHAHLSWQKLNENANDIDLLIPVSRYHEKLMMNKMKLKSDKSRVIYNGTPMDHSSPSLKQRNSTLTIGYLAKICPEKGLHTLVDAFLKLKNQEAHSDLKLAIAGTLNREHESYFNNLRTKLSPHDKDLKICLDISAEEKETFLNEIHLLSVPACYGESFGLYIIEAMSHGVPVVQPESGAFPEILSLTGGGALCRPDDSGDLALRIDELLKDTQGLNSLGEKAKEKCKEHFSIEVMADNTLSLYREYCK